MKRTTIYIRDKQYLQLKEFCELWEIKISEFMRDAIDAHLKRLKAEKRCEQKDQ